MLIPIWNKGGKRGTAAMLITMSCHAPIDIGSCQNEAINQAKIFQILWMYLWCLWKK